MEEGPKFAQRLFVRAASREEQQKQPSASAKPDASQGAAAEAHMQAMAAGCPVVGRGSSGASSSAMAAAAASGCPVVGMDPRNQMPQSSNQPQPGQGKPLSTWRQQSSIPTGSEEVPAHQAAVEPSSTGAGVWVYPSEQMFYNAMRRKGWAPSEQDMSAVVAIHNTVNERAWREILRWEREHAGECGGPRLVRFRGRPQDFSPKARLLNLLGYKLPFDRHDWIVNRCGKEVRYVIDFYNAAPLPSMPVAMHLDVRPALDSPGAVWDRLRMQGRWVASGRWRE